MNTHYFISDLDLDIELLTDIKNRAIEQKQLYLENGANKYYNSTANKIPRPHSSIGFSNDEYADFIYEHCLGNKQHKVAITSLACGNCSKEKRLIERMSNDAYDFIFMGMDSSKSMLQIAEETLHDTHGNIRLICSDFSSPSFRQEVSRLIKEYDQRIFFFLGSTIGNISLTNIADTLSNTLEKGDMLLLDVITRPDESQESDVKIFQKYASYLDIPELVTFYFNPLERIGVPFENGEMTLQMFKEESTGALRFEFGFLFKVKTRLNFREENITILPGENITINTIRVYDPNKFLSFFTEHDFQPIASTVKNNKMIFLLEKTS